MSGLPPLPSVFIILRIWGELLDEAIDGLEFGA